MAELVPNELLTYGDASAVQDVYPLIEILTATENYLLNNLGKTTAINTIHQTQTDTLRTTSSAAVAEESDYTSLARTTPTLLTNLVEIVAIPFAVSRTQQQIQHFSGENELTRQTTKALKEWANAAEFDLIRSTLTSGISGATPKMAGLIQAVSKANNHTSHTSGTAFAASILKSLMKNVVDNGNGETVTDLFMGSYQKTVFDGFTAGQTKYWPAAFGTLTDAVSVYDSGAFGLVKAHYHRYVQQSTDSTGRVVAINMDKLKVAFLQRPFIDTGLARSGDYDKPKLSSLRETVSV